MLIVSHVCAEFTLPDGTPFRIRPQDRRSFLSVPDALSGDLLFQALLEDGSIESAETKQARSRLERDPDANITPSGRKNPAPAEAPSAAHPGETHPGTAAKSAGKSTVAARSAGKTAAAKATDATPAATPKTAADAAIRSANGAFNAAACVAASVEAARTAPAASSGSVVAPAPASGSDAAPAPASRP